MAVIENKENITTETRKRPDFQGVDYMQPLTSRM